MRKTLILLNVIFYVLKTTYALCYLLINNIRRNLVLRYNIDVSGGAQGGFRTYELQNEIFSRGASKGKYLSNGSEKQNNTYDSIVKERGQMWGRRLEIFF